MNARVQERNKGTELSKTPTQRLGKDSDAVISFEHINAHGTKPHDTFVELTNTMEILASIEVGVYILVETQ